MKKIVLLFAMLIAFGVNQSYAKIPVVYGTHEKINEIAKLPSDYDDEAIALPTNTQWLICSGFLCGRPMKEKS